jgi:hypothetical protein
MHRPDLLPGVSWYSFLEAELTPGHMVPSQASEKNPQWQHRGSIPRPSVKQRSALTTMLPQAPCCQLQGQYSRDILSDILEFLALYQMFVYLFISRYLAELPTVFWGKLVEKRRFSSRSRIPESFTNAVIKKARKLTNFQVLVYEKTVWSIVIHFILRSQWGR